MRLIWSVSSEKEGLVFLPSDIMGRSRSCSDLRMTITKIRDIQIVDPRTLTNSWMSQSVISKTLAMALLQTRKIVISYSELWPDLVTCPRVTNSWNMQQRSAVQLLTSRWKPGGAAPRRFLLFAKQNGGGGGDSSPLPSTACIKKIKSHAYGNLVLDISNLMSGFRNINSFNHLK